MNSVLQRIRAAAHWRARIRPNGFQRDRFSLSECKDLVEACQVSLRGWHYPYFRRDRVVALDDSIELAFESERVPEVEYWRFFQSGQFVHYHMMPEEYEGEWARRGEQKLFSVLNALYTITELFEFSTRLAARAKLGNGASIEFTVVGTQGRALFMGERGRHLFDDYVCRLREIRFEKALGESDLLGRGQELALDATVYVLERFNWDRASREMLAEDQRRFLERRL